jgi:hypothetical protein
MDSYIVNVCSDCTSIFDALDRIDNTLCKYAKNRYQNNAYLLNKPFPKQHIKLLIRYKSILEDCTWNADAYLPWYPVSNIIARVKILTNGL